MDVQVKKGKNRFYILYEGQEIGEMTYEPEGEECFAVNHTFTDEHYRGQGIGRKLLEAMVDFAREQHKKIIPVCPYVKFKFVKNPEKYQDVTAG